MLKMQRLNAFKEFYKSKFRGKLSSVNLNDPRSAGDTKNEFSGVSVLRLGEEEVRLLRNDVSFIFLTMTNLEN